MLKIILIILVSGCASVFKSDKNYNVLCDLDQLSLIDKKSKIISEDDYFIKLKTSNDRIWIIPKKNCILEEH